jgi:hypothetical protein
LETNHIPALEVYDQLRRRVEHEDVLITQRLSWLVAAQSFLFSAYAITLNGFLPGVSDPYLAEKVSVHRLIPIVAIWTSGLIYIGIVAGVVAMTRARKFGTRHLQAAELGRLPPIQSSAPIRVFGLAAPLLLPLVFVSSWVYLATR